MSSSTLKAETARKPKRRASKWNRELHRWGSILTAIPLFLVIVSGIVLQLKKDWHWVQPPTQRGSTSELALTFDEVLARAASIPEAQIVTWADVDRLDVRPSKGMLKVRAKNRWEIQLDAATGEVLQVEYRRSDFIESLHDGSFFGRTAKLYVFLPTALILFGLWLTGAYLWWLPHLKRWRRRAVKKSLERSPG